MYWLFFIIFSAVFVTAAIVYFEASQKEKAQIEAEKKAKKEAEKNPPVAKKIELAKAETETPKAEKVKREREEIVSDSPFQKQLNASIITLQEGQEQKKRAERLAMVSKRKEADSCAKEYIEEIRQGILEKAKAGEYTIENSKRVITADIDWPFRIDTTISNGTDGREYALNITMDDMEKFDFFMASLKEMCKKDNISFVPMAKGDCAYSASTPNGVTEIKVPGRFQENIYDIWSVRKFFRCTCVVADRVVTGKEEV